MQNKTPISCPRCGRMMEWLGYVEGQPHITEYLCENKPQCAWQGDYNHLTGIYDELTSEEYVEVQNTNIDELKRVAEELGVDIEEI